MNLFPDILVNLKSNVNEILQVVSNSYKANHYSNVVQSYIGNYIILNFLTEQKLIQGFDAISAEHLRVNFNQVDKITTIIKGFAPIKRKTVLNQKSLIRHGSHESLKGFYIMCDRYGHLCTVDFAIRQKVEVYLVTWVMTDDRYGLFRHENVFLNESTSLNLFNSLKSISVSELVEIKELLFNLLSWIAKASKEGDKTLGFYNKSKAVDPVLSFLLQERLIADYRIAREDCFIQLNKKCLDFSIPLVTGAEKLNTNSLITATVLTKLKYQQSADMFFILISQGGALLTVKQAFSLRENVYAGVLVLTDFSYLKSLEFKDRN